MHLKTFWKIFSWIIRFHITCQARSMHKFGYSFIWLNDIIFRNTKTTTAAWISTI